MFRRFKLASLLNLAGLCIALTSFYLFSTKVEESVKYNTCFDDWRRMYRVEIKGQIFDEDSVHIANLPIGSKDIISAIPEVESFGYLHADSRNITFTNEDNKRASFPYYYECAEILDFFNVGFINRQKTHNEGDIVIPASLAKWKFGKEDVVGDSLVWQIDGTTTSCRIAGVYKNFPRNCSLDNAIYRYSKTMEIMPWGNFNYNFYVKLRDNNDKAEVEKQLLTEWYRYIYTDGTEEVNYETAAKNTRFKVILQTLHWTYFSRVDESDKGREPLLVILFFSAIFILVLTNVNTMNFTLAMAPMRVKSINTHRVVGASRPRIMFELVMESIFIGLIAFVISTCLLFLIDMVLVGNVNPLCHIRVLVYTFIVSIAISIISSVYPAYFATSFEPSMALKGTFGLSKLSKRLRMVRVGFQIIISSVAFTCTLIMVMQQYYVFNTEYGYTKNHILFSQINSMEGMKRKQEVKKKLEEIDEIQSISFSKFAIGTEDRYMWWSRRTPDDKYIVLSTVIPVDKDYLKTMGIEIIEGRDFNSTDNGAYIFNEAARKKYSWLKTGEPMLPESDSLDAESHYPVVGFCNNIIFSSVRKNNENNVLAFYLPAKKNEYYASNTSIINIRLTDDADPDAVIPKIQKVYSKIVPEEKSELEICTIQEKLESLYNSELVFYVQFGSIAIVYISITLIGVFCITLFESEYRRKEIGIRKVFGASTEEILLMFNKKFFLIATLCYAISIPPTWMLSQNLLSEFTVRSPYLWLMYPVSYGIIIFMILGTVTIQSWKNANDKPVNSIKNE